MPISKEEFTNLHAANAPRWLISKGRKEDAIRTLEKVRPKDDVGVYLPQKILRINFHVRGAS